MKITIYELLGMIKDGKAPKKIKYDNIIFEYDNIYYMAKHIYLDEYCDLIRVLNEEVEILEEELKDNWNKLKEHIETCINETKQNDVYDRTSYEQGVITGLESSLFKMQELESDDSDE